MSFSEKIYEKLKEVPKGKLTTYKDLAHSISSKAYRAVGLAMNRNPYAPKVPCHRVIGNSGSLVGFASGLKNKRILLKKEGIKIKNNKVVDFEKHLHKFK